MSCSMFVMQEWTTEAGLPARCLLIQHSHLCGYVAVPPGYPLHGVDYEEGCPALGGVSPAEVLRVHGGVTFSGEMGYIMLGDHWWWFGFDCAHAGDKTADSPGTERTVEYVMAECEELAGQIVDWCGRPKEVQDGPTPTAANATEG